DITEHCYCFTGLAVVAFASDALDYYSCSFAIRASDRTAISRKCLCYSAREIDHYAPLKVAPYLLNRLERFFEVDRGSGFVAIMT
ncbi:hypothetical protein, partial [Pseudomonas helleri]|uniref:hypothetical protein n=1 Tax=Pseudomonas helleri TaxID=1608996 RepID=UPI001E56618B